MKSTTKIRHRAIYNRFLELTKLCRQSGQYNKLYLSNFYVQIADEMGYSENYVCRVICKQKRLDEC